MRPWVGHLLAMGLGIGLTVSAYEARRLYVNTTRTVAAAQLQLEQRAARVDRRAKTREAREARVAREERSQARARAQGAGLMPEEIREELRDAAQSARDGREEPREVLQGLSPEAKEVVGSALRKRLQTVRERRRAGIEPRGRGRGVRANEPVQAEDPFDPDEAEPPEDTG